MSQFQIYGTVPYCPVQRGREENVGKAAEGGAHGLQIRRQIITRHPVCPGILNSSSTHLYVFFFPIRTNIKSLFLPGFKILNGFPQKQAF